MQCEPHRFPTCHTRLFYVAHYGYIPSGPIAPHPAQRSAPQPQVEGTSHAYHQLAPQAASPADVTLSQTRPFWPSELGSQSIASNQEAYAVHPSIIPDSTRASMQVGEGTWTTNPAPIESFSGTLTPEAGPGQSFSAPGAQARRKVQASITFPQWRTNTALAAS